MRTIILQTLVLVTLILLCGCQSPIRGTWIQTGKASVAPDGTVEQIQLEQPSVLVFRDDGWNCEYAIRNEQLEYVGEGKYKTHGNRLTYMLSSPPFAGEITGRFARNGDELMIELAAREGYDREIFRKID